MRIRLASGSAAITTLPTTARKEQRWAAQTQAVAAAHLVRVDRIERLRKALLSGNAAALLRADNNEARAEGSSRAVRAAMAPAALSPVLRPHASLQHIQLYSTQ